MCSFLFPVAALFIVAYCSSINILFKVSCIYCRPVSITISSSRLSIMPKMLCTVKCPVVVYFLNILLLSLWLSWIAYNNLITQTLFHGYNFLTDGVIVWPQVHDWLSIFTGSACRRKSSRKIAERNSSAIPRIATAGRFCYT